MSSIAYCLSSVQPFSAFGGQTSLYKDGDGSLQLVQVSDKDCRHLSGDTICVPVLGALMLNHYVCTRQRQHPVSNEEAAKAARRAEWHLTDGGAMGATSTIYPSAFKLETI
jgi:hypothetical protein